MIKNVSELQKIESINGRIIIIAATPGSYKTTSMIQYINNYKDNCLFISLEMSPTYLAKNIKNELCDISDKIIFNSEKLKKYKLIIIDYIQLVKNCNHTLSYLKKIRDLGINIIILSQLNRRGNSYRHLKNSSYLEEIADKVFIYTNNNPVLNIKCEKNRYGKSQWELEFQVKNKKIIKKELFNYIIESDLGD